MFKRQSKGRKERLSSSLRSEPKPLIGVSVNGLPNNSSSHTAAYLNSLSDPNVIERVRVTIKHAHVFKLPTRQTVSVGWRGADWKEKVWQGTVKVVERNDMTAVLLVNTDGTTGASTIFAVCPIQQGAVERCIDSSRYFVLRIENETGRHMFIGVAFNERNDAFDFNTALEDSRLEREKELEAQTNAGVSSYSNDHQPAKDYSLKKGEKIHVAFPATATLGGQAQHARTGGTEAFANFYNDSPTDSPQSSENNLGWENGTSASTGKKIVDSKRKAKSSKAASGGLTFLKPCARDTPTRAQQKQT